MTDSRDAGVEAQDLANLFEGRLFDGLHMAEVILAHLRARGWRDAVAIAAHTAAAVKDVVLGHCQHCQAVAADLTARLAERYQEGREDGIDFAREQVETAQGELMKALARLAAAITERDAFQAENHRLLVERLKAVTLPPPGGQP